MKRILVLMTTSPASRIAFDEALAMANQTGARVRLARVLGFRRPSAALIRAEDWLEQLEAHIPSAQRDGVVALVGPAPLAIRRAVEAYAADTVVIGARAYAALVRNGVDTVFVDRVGPKLLVVRPSIEPSASATVGAHRTHDDHTLLEAATLAGAATGMVTGALAGPPGAIVGAALGTAIGMLAGRALETADDRAGRHERELDDAIGVTSGPVGMATVRAGADAKTASPDEVPAEESLAAAGQALARAHGRLERIYDALAEACRAADWPEVHRQWDACEPALREHMADEERSVFPIFARANPGDAARLTAEHEELRRHLDEIAVAVELHSITPNQIAYLVERLCAHGRREADVLYPWMETARAADTGKTLAA